MFPIGVVVYVVFDISLEEGLSNCQRSQRDSNFKCEVSLTVKLYSLETIHEHYLERTSEELLFQSKLVCD